MKIKNNKALLRDRIANLVRKYYNQEHANRAPFVPGQRIPYGGRVYDEREMVNLVDSALEFWLSAGRFVRDFEKKLAGFLGLPYCSAVNSGSSANLLAFMCLTSRELGPRRIKPGDEVITVAACFPTTVAPILQYGAKPVFVDVTLPTYNIDCSQLTRALSKKTKAVMLAHTLGNPFDLHAVKEFCDKHGLWLIEDNCDALGSRYRYQGTWRYTGSLGHLGTSSFYPPHHITMGEGGAVYTENPQLKRLVESFRDWGRDCWCGSGRDNTCKKRFKHKFAHLPPGYDHKYVYSHFGYNLKITEMQAAVGCAQLDKLPDFMARRKNNWQELREGLAPFSKQLIMPEPTPNSDPSWFGFPLTVREKAPFDRSAIVGYLEKHGIQTRMLFAGNVIRHPCFDGIRSDKTKYRVAGKLRNTDLILKNTFWTGVYPGIDDKMLKYTLDVFKRFFKD